jgi:hypothetical protein
VAARIISAARKKGRCLKLSWRKEESISQVDYGKGEKDARGNPNSAICNCFHPYQII